MNTNTNTNKVIIIKLYGFSYCAIVCVVTCVISSCVNFIQKYFPCTIKYIVWSNDENRIINDNTLCQSLSPSSAVVDCYIGTCWYVRRNDNDTLICWMMTTSQPPCWICCHVCVCVHPFPQGYVPSIYVLVGNAVDCSIIWWCRVGIDDLVHG